MKFLIGVVLILGVVFAGFYLKERPAALDSKLEQYITQAEASGDVFKAAVYVEDLETGQSYGYKSNDEFRPKSIGKVIVLMSIFKEAETNPEVLKKRLDYNSFFNRGAHYAPNDLQNGTYTALQLISQVIKESDDGALWRLDDAGKNKVVQEALGIPVPKEDEIYYISPKDVSKMFKALYHGTFMSRESSDKALSMLLETKFNKGIEAGVPKEVKVANKFGEDVIYDVNTVVGAGLNDCGIVYTERPYVICVMTQGKSFEVLERTIAEISRITYTELSKN